MHFFCEIEALPLETINAATSTRERKNINILCKERPLPAQKPKCFQ